MKSPAFQFYARDFLTDEKCASMTFAERGLYITLLSHAWLEGSIPNNVGAIARLVRSPEKEIKALWPAVVVCFHDNGADRLVNGRMEGVRESLEAYRELQSRKGKASAAARAKLQPDVSHGSTAVDSRLQPEANSASATASASYSPNGELSPPEKTKRVRPPVEPGPTFAGDLERQTCALIALIAAENKGGLIAESRISSIRFAIAERIEKLGASAVAYGVAKAVAAGKPSLEYAVAVAKGYDPTQNTRPLRSVTPIRGADFDSLSTREKLMRDPSFVGSPPIEGIL